MLLLHQVGSVKIGEVVRYTVTYTPSHDRILPSPECLHLRIKNTSLIALRAAFVHGPYTLSVAAYPAHYDPNRKFANPRRYGVPEFEPMLKAGGVWSCRLLVPDNIRQSAGCGVSQGHFGGVSTAATATTTDPANLTSSSSSTSEAIPPQPALDSASWVIEISSQVIFSTSAAVNYEILLARDEKSLSLGAPAVSVIGGTHAQAPQPGKVSDFTSSPPESQQQQQQGRGALQKGVYSGAIRLKVEDTAALWDTPRLGYPSPPNVAKAKQHVRPHNGSAPGTTGPVSTAPQSQPQSGTTDADGKGENGQGEASTEPRSKDGGEGSQKLDDNKQKIHLVILTHGLHSNLGADMLFLKESIDSAARQAKIDGRARRAREAQERREERRKQREERLQAREKQAAKAKEDEEEEYGSASTETPAKAQSEDANGVSAPQENPTEMGCSVNTSSAPKTDGKPPHLGETDLPDDGEDGGDDDQVVEDDEEVVVRGFSGNATRTERGIKYLGKRLARYILSMTYPDQPFLPASMAVAKEAVAQAAAKKEGGASGAGSAPAPAHKHSSICKAARASDDTRSYRITKISFVGHSLGGLVQLYAIAYIQKHSPDFFRLIEPINFIALASPLLGLNHENPLYFKFALDFGLVGRTGQDLGLTWRAPTIARSGWSAIVSNLGENAHKKLLGGEAQAESKPLLRILPTGPAHVALRAFRNRTLYSNVVNDGIVPLRTSCLLFLDWQGLGRVEKARREAGLVETVVGFGWSELMGANVTSPREPTWQADDSDEEADGSSGTKRRQSPEGGSNSSCGRLAGLAIGGGGDGDQSPNHDGAVTPMAPNSHEVPQPSGNAILEDDRQSIRSVASPAWGIHSTSSVAAANPFTGIFNFFRKDEPAKETPPSQKQTQIFRRSQTLLTDEGSYNHSASSSRSKVTSGHELSDEPSENGMSAPPRTTFFEAAGDLLNPKLPSVEYLIDPSKRPRTIFHDRIYHPSDIPPPPVKKRPTSSSLHIRRRSKVDFSEDADAGPNNNLKPAPKVAGSGEAGSGLTAKSAAKQSISMPPSPVMSPQQLFSPQSTVLSPITDDGGGGASGSKRSKEPAHVVDSAGMRVEEKIARAYHRGLSWRKVLVKLEPDAHNNIIVRRTFPNAFGWPVVKHLVDAHFSDLAAARTPDSAEPSRERAAGLGLGPDERGEETTTQEPETKSTNRIPEDEGRRSHDFRPVQAPGRSASLKRTASEAREAADKVSDLPSTPPQRRSSMSGTMVGSDGPSTPPSGTSSGISGRPNCDRLDSMTWSERDWDDSGDDSDDEDFASPRSASHATGLGHHSWLRRKGTGSGSSSSATAGPSSNNSGSGSSSSWNWTEKIVGKGATKSSRGGRGGPSLSPAGAGTNAEAAASSVVRTPGGTKVQSDDKRQAN